MRKRFFVVRLSGFVTVDVYARTVGHAVRLAIRWLHRALRKRGIQRMPNFPSSLDGGWENVSVVLQR